MYTPPNSKYTTGPKTIVLVIEYPRSNTPIPERQTYSYVSAFTQAELVFFPGSWQQIDL